MLNPTWLSLLTVSFLPTNLLIQFSAILKTKSVLALPIKAVTTDVVSWDSPLKVYKTQIRATKS